jgi:hypothetical protein
MRIEKLWVKNKTTINVREVLHFVNLHHVMILGK